LTIFYTVIGGAPEAIFTCTLNLNGDWRAWRVNESVEVLRPARAYEGADCQNHPSELGAIDMPVNQLRDPDVFVDIDGSAYLPNAVAGEAGIAIARLT
jgi:hypothetical protein